MLPDADGRWVTQSPAGTSEPQCRGLRRNPGGDDGVEGQELRSAWGQT